MFKEILLQLWSRSVFPTLFLLCFLFYLLTVCQLGGKQAGVEQDTCPIYAVYHVLYLWTWEVSRMEAIVSHKIRVYHPPLAKTVWLLSTKSSSLNKCLRSKVLMSFQAFIKHCLWERRHSATSGMLRQICQVSLWRLAPQRHNYFKAFTCS